MFWRTFTELCAKAGKSPSRVAEEIGLSPSLPSSWKRGAIPTERNLMRIARYFRVPVQDLTSEEDCKSITPDMIKEPGMVIDLRRWPYMTRWRPIRKRGESDEESPPQ